MTRPLGDSMYRSPKAILILNPRVAVRNLPLYIVPFELKLYQSYISLSLMEKFTNPLQTLAKRVYNSADADVFNVVHLM